MTYAVKELFYSLQGEGANAGRATVFCRFSGCNLWSGNEADRATAVCKFCDTDFVGTDGTHGGKYRTTTELVEAVDALWPSGQGEKFTVLTGGEPLLQLDTQLLDEFHAHGFKVAIETNGTRIPPPGVDWICVSPKAGAEFVLKTGNELKVVWPQPGLDLDSLEKLEFNHRFLQPMDGPVVRENTAACVEYCMKHPTWRLSLQTHKILGVR